jgi:hypothetical protein
VGATDLLRREAGAPGRDPDDIVDAKTGLTRLVDTMPTPHRPDSGHV